MNLDELDVSKDLEFMGNLMNFIERRDQAVSRPLPSNVAISLRSYVIGLTALYYFREMEQMAITNDLYELIAENKRQARKLTKRVQTIANREHLWRKPRVIEKNKRKVVELHNKALRLHEQAQLAYESLQRANDG